MRQTHGPAEKLFVDFAGDTLPVRASASPAKVEFTIAKFNLDLDLQLIPPVLTPEQCREYRLPRTPIKETERRKDRFEETFGGGATELDALEALYPGELARLLNAELDNWLDRDLDARSESVHRRLINDLGIVEEEVRSAYEVQIARLRSAFNSIVERVNDINNELSNWQEQASTLWTQIVADLEEAAPDLSEVEMPESEAPGTTDRFVLFDSQRDYFSQMDAYNVWRNGDESNGAAQ